MEKIWQRLSKIEKWIGRYRLAAWLLESKGGLIMIYALGVAVSFLVGQLNHIKFTEQIEVTFIALAVLILVPIGLVWFSKQIGIRGEKMVITGIGFLCVGILVLFVGVSLIYMGKKDMQLSSQQETQQVAPQSLLPKQSTVPTDHKLETLPRPSAPEQTVKTKNLYDLFLSDFNKTHILGEYFLTAKQGTVYRIEYILWGDFDTKTIYYSVFLRKADLQFDYTSEACVFLIPLYREILQGELKLLMQGIKYHPPGSKIESWDELIFSGRVYIYYEAYLLPEQIDSLMEEYKKQGLSPQFRGKDYLIMKNSPLYNQ